jgi:hypothetical protein
MKKIALAMIAAACLAGVSMAAQAAGGAATNGTPASPLGVQMAQGGGGMPMRHKYRVTKRQRMAMQHRRMMKMKHPMMRMKHPRMKMKHPKAM